MPNFWELYCKNAGVRTEKEENGVLFAYDIKWESPTRTLSIRVSEQTLNKSSNGVLYPIIVGKLLSARMALFQKEGKLPQGEADENEFTSLVKGVAVQEWISDFDEEQELKKVLDGYREYGPAYYGVCVDEYCYRTKEAREAAKKDVDQKSTEVV